MAEGNEWYLKPSLIKIVIIIFAMGCVTIGVLCSPKDSDVLKGYFQSGGVLLSFLGFLLMLFSSATLQKKDNKIKVFVSIHATNFMFLVGVLCVFFGFLFQALGIAKIPF